MRNYICISGKARAGKDAAADLLKENLSDQGYSVLVIHYADLLKFICKTYFGWNGEKDGYGRTLLQKVGTNVIRKQNPDFWVDFVIEITTLFDGRWDYIIIPDARFPNEVDKLKSSASTVTHLRIERPSFLNELTVEQRQHPSEVALDNTNPDFTIVNDGDLSTLAVKVRDVAAKIILSHQ